MLGGVRASAAENFSSVKGRNKVTGSKGDAAAAEEEEEEEEALPLRVEA